jgi:mono/diheme cytochrome c family protein
MRALLPFLGLLLLAACGDSDSPLTGTQLYRVQCSMCHGTNGEGMKGFAPTLHGKKANWTREKLIAYLQDPAAFREKDPRLHAQGTAYSLPMPTYSMLKPDELGKLADHVLAMP